MLGLKLTKAECRALLADILSENLIISKLLNMSNNWHEGETFADYGLAPDADISGFRSKTFNSHSTSYQNVVNEMEGNTMLSIGIGLGNAIVGGVGYYTLGLHGLIHGISEK